MGTCSFLLAATIFLEFGDEGKGPGRDDTFDRSIETTDHEDSLLRVLDLG